MQRSSETIGAIAAALAKAQSELVDPEKSLTATIRSLLPRESDRTFRYASLSTGLDIIRKSLSRHEIAAIQTTAIDYQARLVRLTTVLAHSSGEWMSSEWPVCSVTDTATPRKMGAALTYARRYSLFALVGIAGEDDLDAPDLDPSPSNQPGATNGYPAAAPKNSGKASRAPLSGRAVYVSLDPAQSVELRDKLVAEVARLSSAESAAEWAQRMLPLKNSLGFTDAKVVEETFAAKLAHWCEGPELDCRIEARHADDGVPISANKQSTDESHVPNKPKTRRTMQKASRIRDPDHRKYVSCQPCAVCGRSPSDAHHLRFAQPRALGRKVSDEFTVPLCRTHHRELHRLGDEEAWWEGKKLDPQELAADLWAKSRNGQINA